MFSYSLDNRWPAFSSVKLFIRCKRSLRCRMFTFLNSYRLRKIFRNFFPFLSEFEVIWFFPFSIFIFSLVICTRFRIALFSLVKVKLFDIYFFSRVLIFFLCYVRIGLNMVPQQGSDLSPTPRGGLLFGSQLVDKNSATPYSDATQVSYIFLCCARDFFFFKCCYLNFSSAVALSARWRMDVRRVLPCVPHMTVEI